MFRAYAITIRLAYLSAVAAGLLMGGWAALSIANAPVPGLFSRFLSVSELAWFSLFFACLCCAIRATVRAFGHEPLIPESLLRERPVVGTLVACAGAFASFLLFNVALAFLHTWPDTSDVNFAGPLALALMLLAISLLTGEIVLVGRVTRPQAALAPFPGNGV